MQNLNFESFMDVGCAEGMYLVGVKELWPNIDVYGVDFSSEALKKAFVYNNRSDTLLLAADGTRLPFKDACVDTVLCSETLEHIVNDQMAFKELARISRKSCILTVPSFNNAYAKKHFKPDVECNKDSHLRKYTKEDLQAILQPYFRKVMIYHMSFWYLSSIDVVLHMFTPKKFSATFSHLLSIFVNLDYKMCKAGVHGHSYICICRH